CTTCHGLGTRPPNLLTDEQGTGPIGARCGQREAGKSCKQYLYASLDNPTAYIVSGYQPIMPVMTRQLSPEQIWAVIAYLESQGGIVDVTGSDIPAAAAAPAASTAPGGGAAGGGGGLAGGSTDPKDIIQAAGWLACHKPDRQRQATAPARSGRRWGSWCSPTSWSYTSCRCCPAAPSSRRAWCCSTWRPCS